MNNEIKIAVKKLLDHRIYNLSIIHNTINFVLKNHEVVKLTFGKDKITFAVSAGADDDFNCRFKTEVKVREWEDLDRLLEMWGHDD